jgi:hypothetical protein
VHTYVQAVDGGLGANIKFLMSKQLEKWMEVDDNLDQWENGSISASDKTILITKFSGCAWEELYSYHTITHVRTLRGPAVF